MSVAEHMSNRDLTGWKPLTAIKVVEKRNTVEECGNYRKYTPFVNTATGEIVFALCYMDKSTTPLDEEGCRVVLFEHHSKDSSISMESICAAGNRTNAMRTEAYLPDQYVFDYTLKHGTQFRGFNPRTFEEYLSIATRLEPPSTPMSVHSPGVNQQFNTAASIMAEPTKLPPPPEEEEPAKTKRKARKPAATKRKGRATSPVESPKSESPSPKRKSSPPPEETEQAPKRTKVSQKKVKAIVPTPLPVVEIVPKKKKKDKNKSEISCIIQAIYDYVKGVVDKFSETSKEWLRKNMDYSSVTGSAYSITQDLDDTVALFAIITYAHLEQGNTCSFAEIFEAPTGPLEKWTEEQFAVVQYFQRQLSSTYKDFEEFITKGLCYRKNNSKSRTIYNSKISSIIKEIQQAENSKTKIEEILKRLNNSEKSGKKLLLYFLDLNGAEPTAEAEPNFLF